MHHLCIKCANRYHLHAFTHFPSCTPIIRTTLLACQRFFLSLFPSILLTVPDNSLNCSLLLLRNIKNSYKKKLASEIVKTLFLYQPIHLERVSLLSTLTHIVSIHISRLFSFSSIHPRRLLLLCVYNQLHNQYSKNLSYPNKFPKHY